MTKMTGEMNISMAGVTEILLAAERTEENLTFYRDKLQLLQKIDLERVEEVLGKMTGENKVLSMMPLHVLLGGLYTNFTLMWDPIMKLLEGYASTDRREDFWAVFYKKLVTAYVDIEEVM